MRNLLYTLVLIAVIALISCEKEKIYIDREVIVEVEVEVDSNPLPDSLQMFLDNEAKFALLYSEINRFFTRDGATYVIVSFGKNNNSLNSNYPSGLPESCISMQAYDGNTRITYSTLRVNGHPIEIQPTGTFAEFNPYFYAEDQYVYKIVTFIPE